MSTLLSPNPGAPYRLALVMIVKNEARGLARCLQSVQGVVDECIVLDTGSTDDTVAIAQAHGARVAHFSWVDDFSAARNAALALSNAHWHLVLDGDEWLPAADESGPARQAIDALQQLRHQAPCFVGLLEVHSAFDAQGQSASSWLPRVLPGPVRYSGRVHEQPEWQGPRQRLPVCVQHDGYLPAQRALKGTRNQQLLELALQEHPTDAYLHYQLGKDLEVRDLFEPALQAYRQAMRLLGPEAGRSPAWRHDLLLRTLFVLQATGLTEEAIALAEPEMAQWTDSPDFYFVLGDVLLTRALAHPETANDLLPMIESCWQQCLALGDGSPLEGHVHGRGSHLAAHNLVVFYESLGMHAQADAYRSRAKAP
jgi:tetratricopeptide (TPR) repeat protein